MKKFALIIIKTYHHLFSPLLHQLLGTGQACRYSPTCSEFATIHIAKEGMLIGGAKTIMRILYCNPFAKKLPAYLQ